MLCSKCGQDKPQSDFSFRSKVKNILHKRCKSCYKDYSKSHYINNSDDYKRRARTNSKQYMEQNREFVSNYKAEHGCCFCGEREPITLDLHHVDEKTKYKNVSRLVSSYASLSLLLIEIEKCVVICSNCHRKLHAGLIKWSE